MILFIFLKRPALLNNVHMRVLKTFQRTLKTEIEATVLRVSRKHCETAQANETLRDGASIIMPDSRRKLRHYMKKTTKK
eukprot:UN12358